MMATDLDVNEAKSPTTPTPGGRKNSTSLSIVPPKAHPFLDSITTTTPTVPLKTPNTPRDQNAIPPSPAPSLTSTRPPPPSPAVSRRASQATSVSSGSNSGTGSGSGGTRSRGGSRRNSRRTSRLSDSISVSVSLSRAGSTTQKSSSSHRLSNSITPSQLPTPSLNANVNNPTTPTSVISKLTSRILTIKIRDFAFVHNDDKHLGLGPEVPRANRPKHLLRLLNSHLRNSSISTTSSVVSDKEEEEEDEDDDIGAGFKFGLGRLSWSFGKSSSSTSSSSNNNGNTYGTNSSASYPSKSDLDRNFSSSSSSSSSSSPDSEKYFDSHQHPSDEIDEEYEDGYEEDDYSHPLLPGIYRALFPFTPEGPTEMALEENQQVHVLGRGGGTGWAVVVVDNEAPEENRKHALVPESYLELVSVDEEYEEQVRDAAETQAGDDIGARSA